MVCLRGQTCFPCRFQQLLEIVTMKERECWNFHRLHSALSSRSYSVFSLTTTNITYSIIHILRQTFSHLCSPFSEMTVNSLITWKRSEEIFPSEGYSFLQRVHTAILRTSLPTISWRPSVLHIHKISRRCDWWSTVLTSTPKLDKN